MKVIEGQFDKKEQKNVIQFLKDTIKMVEEDGDTSFSNALVTLQTESGRTITTSNTDFETSIVMAEVTRQVVLDLYMGESYD